MTEHPAGGPPTPADVQAAAARIKGQGRVTPVLSDPDLDEQLGFRVFFKCENLQRTGAFKFRGACNAVRRLDERGVQGDVATHSSGNHGAALALAARLSGRKAHIVMPENALASKFDNVRRNGGEVHECEASQAAREAGLERLVDEQGCVPIPPYDHADVIAGQGTAALELLAQVDGLDALITPVGGGGLVSGCALAAQTARTPPRVYAAEPAGADDTARSVQAGRRVTDIRPDTVCDGLRAIVGVLNFELIARHVSAVFTVQDPDTVSAMRTLRHHLGLLVEPSSSLVLAALLAERERFEGQRVGVILTGGNLDLAHLPDGFLDERD
ncbi:MAG: pyridoxal-phosphate dependent enzyme [Xanthomonadales bacterium]|nr:pyridoxal-phosphate dependent enzyme [Xanthomonadales bacterium]